MTASVHLKHVKRYRVGGRVYLYHRKTGERLPDNPVDRAARVREINEDEDPDQRRALERLKRKETALRGTIQDLEKTARDLRRHIKSAQAQARHLNVHPDAVNASMRPDAFWPWEPPMPAPKRSRHG